MTNVRPCGACRHLDGRQNPAGAAYCWATYTWQRTDGVVTNCTQAQRADGKPPPGQIRYTGERL